MPNAELSEFKRLCELVDHNEIKKAELNQLYAEQKILFSPNTLKSFVYAKAGKPARSYLSMKKPPKITPSKRQRSKSPQLPKLSSRTLTSWMRGLGAPSASKSARAGRAAINERLR